MPKGEKGTSRPYLRGSVYWIKYYVQGKAVRESTQKTIYNEAVQVLNQKRVAADRGELTASKCKIHDLFDLVLKEQRRRKRNDIKHVESRIANHLEPWLGKLLITRLNNVHIDQYIDRRLDEGDSHSTINRELAILKAALRLGYFRNPPLVGRMITWRKLPEDDNVRKGFVDWDDYRRFLDELPDELKMLLVFGFHYGIRKSELLTYQWPYVDFFSREIRVPQPHTKNREPKIIPFYGDVPHWLENEKTIRDRRFPDCPWIFHRKGKRIKDFRESWEQAALRADLPNSLGWFHDLRRSAVRNMESAGIDRKTAMGISGHKTDSVYRRYRIVSSRDLRTAADKMNDYFSKEQERLESQKGSAAKPIGVEGTKEGTTRALSKGRFNKGKNSK